MKFVQVCDVGLGGGDEVVIRVDGEVWVIALIGEEGGYARGSTRRIVVGEFRERKEFRPIALLVVAVDPKVLLECLVGTLGLTISLGVITGGEMQAHVQSFTKRSEEVGYKLRALIGGDVGGDSMFGEDMEEEQFR